MAQRCWKKLSYRLLHLSALETEAGHSLDFVSFEKTGNFGPRKSQRTCGWRHGRSRRGDRAVFRAAILFPLGLSRVLFATTFAEISHSLE